MAVPTDRNLHAIPIASRPSSRNLCQLLLGISFAILFNFGCLMIQGSQLLFLIPLRIVLVFAPFPWLQRLHESGVRWTKCSFARLLMLVCQWFAPTRMLITLEGDNLKEEVVVERDSNGRVVKLKLPEKLVLIANHQIYADWLYLWCLAYQADLQSDVLIVLKNSLKWIPIVGWGMQCFHFIFLARSWAHDRLNLSKKLSRLAYRAQLRSNPLALMIFPEGTLVSKDTRPISKKFADKMGIVDMRHTLLPRSTGLLYSLRSLSPQIPGLHLLDITIGYEGIPPQGYGQSYYTLRSIFFDGVPPPRIHLRLRLYDVRKDVPIGNLSFQSSASSTKHVVPPSPGASSPATPGFNPPDPLNPPAGHVSREQREKDVDPTAEEAAHFEEWLRNIWREKDALMEQFSTTGTFTRQTMSKKDSTSKTADPVSSNVIEVPLELRSKWEILDAFVGFLPILVPALTWALWKKLP